MAGGSLNVFDEPRDAPAYFECEFESEEAARAYRPPEFVTAELTAVPREL